MLEQITSAVAAMWQRRPILCGCLVMTTIVLVANPYLLNHRGYLYGDAVDNWLSAFRWYGASARAGVFGDFFPFAFSGFSHGWSPELGLYNPIYQICAVLFVDSLYSVKICYLILLNFIWALTFVCANGFGLSRWSSAYAGFGVVASGFVIGNAQHLSYLSSAAALLAGLAGLLAAQQRRHGRSAVLLGAGVLHGATAGYPTILLFGCQALVLYAAWLLWRRELSWRGLGAVVTGTAIGLFLAGPALAHAYRGISLSSRGAGLAVETVMLPAGSLPLASLGDLIWPFRNWPLGDVDPSMDRFHALFSTTLLLLTGPFFLRQSGELRTATGRRFLLLCMLAGLTFLLATGDQLVPLRRLLAELLPFYRYGRFPGAEHKPVALLCLVLASAITFERLTRIRPRWRFVLLLVACIDFGLIYGTTSSLRLTLARKTSLLGQPLARLPVVLGPEDQDLLDRPRHCSRIPAVQYLGVYAQPEFSWWGYCALRLQRYERDRHSLRDQLCGGGRLFRQADGRRLDYTLRRYEPGLVEITLTGLGVVDRDLVWAETTDGFWQISVNGTAIPITAGPGALRSFTLPTTAAPPFDLRMVYRGPLSRFFRSLN